MENLRRSCNFDKGFYVDPNGLSGGLALWWCDSIQIEVKLDSINIIHTEIHDSQTNKKWSMSFVYGCPNLEGKEQVWNEMRKIKLSNPGPWVCVGDFNDISAETEKLGGNRANIARMSKFRNMIDDCELLDLSFKGSPFTWRGKSKGGETIRERLDRALGNYAWCSLFPQALVTHEYALGSDHCPILLHFAFPMKKSPFRFRFEAMWASEAECGEVIKDKWERQIRGSPQSVLSGKLKECSDGLRKWSKNFFRGRREEIENLKSWLRNYQNRVDFDCDIENEAKMKLDKCLEQDEMFWLQRSRLNYIKFGDRNSNFFHRTATIRKRKNLILKLKAEDGEWVEKEDLNKLITDHFSKLFTADSRIGNTAFLDDIPAVVSESMNIILCSPISDEEIKDAVFAMGALKSPGPDGFQGIFYQKYWDVIKLDLCTAVKSFFQNGFQCKDWNNTSLVLIPKKKFPERVADFRPISLCNYCYKIISKVMATRIKPFMNKLISPQQSAFVSGRQIQDNVILAHECFHALRRMKKGKNHNMALKIDLNKAYDRVDWDFLEAVMKRMGFEDKWVSWVMDCVRSVRFSIMVNGSNIGDIKPSRGIRQGDPLSPYLFLFVADVLSKKLNVAVNNGVLKSFSLCRGCPIVSHLLFADDSLIFIRANEQEIRSFKGILQDFCDASGQSVNFTKSEVIFSPNCPLEKQQNLLQLIGMERFKQNSKYLGLPVEWGGSKSSVMAYLRESILNKIQGWKKKFMSSAAREILIKAVAQAIPSYPMTCFLIPKLLCNQIDSLVAKFWWGGDGEEEKIHWKNWKYMTRPKIEGGLGFRNLHTFNYALLAKQFWRLIHNTDQLWARVLKALYFPNEDCLKARKGYRPSWAWSSLLKGRELLSKGLRWNIYNGESVDFWKDDWIPNVTSFKVGEQKPTTCNLEKVSDFIDKNSKKWDKSKLLTVIRSSTANYISKIPIGQGEGKDKLVWHFTKNGIYTVKSGYWLENTQTRPLEEAGSSSRFTSKFWNRVWNAETAPRVRHFFWKALTNSLATNENLFKRKSGPTPMCPLCDNNVETIEHILLQCSWTRPVWFGSQLCARIIPESITSVASWVMQALELYSNEHVLELIMNLCWQIWKTRNDVIFNGEKSKPEQVIRRATRMLKDFIKECYCLNGNKTDKDHIHSSWKKPTNGNLKINIDASFKSDSVWAGGGVIVRNESGELVDIWCGAFKTTSPLSAEAWTLRVASRMAKGKGWTNVEFESDSIELIRCCKREINIPPWEIDAIVTDILALKKDMNWSYIWTPRASNEPANFLANYVRVGVLDSRLLALPDQFWLLLYNDLYK